MEEATGITATTKAEEQARRQAAEEKRAAMMHQLEEVIAESAGEPKPELSPEEEAEIEEMWEATWGHLKRRG